MDPTHLTQLLLQVAIPSRPTSLGILWLPGLLALAGGAIFYSLYAASLRSRESNSWRHVGTLLIMGAWALSLLRLMRLWDPQTGPIYRAEIFSQNTIRSHYFFPVVLLIGLVGIGLAESHLNKVLPGKTEPS